MKIVIKTNNLEQEEIKKELSQGNFEIVSSNGDYELRKLNKNKISIIGEKNDEYFIITPKDIINVESYDHDVICHCINGSFSIEEKLYEIAGMFEDYGMIRVHKSYVVNKTHIKKIIPEINRKFQLILTDNHKIEVSRRYFIEFKESIGMKVKS